ncbi:radical SAM protein [Mycoplasmatota bacterium WC44]
MIIRENAKKILIRNSGEDSIFGNDYYMNIYRGCTHGCIYCDSRSECYQVKNFDTDVIIKENAIELLEKELKSKRKKGIVSISGSMCDSYMHIERKLELSRKALEVIYKHNFAVQVHTKSDLVIRDIDLLTKIDNKSNANVLFTITTASDKISSIIEPNSPVSSDRFKAIKELSDKGVTTGIAIWPILPFITDSKENIISLIKMASEAGATYVLFGSGVTLRGNQREYFYKKLTDAGSNLAKKYIDEYGVSYECIPKNIDILKKAFMDTCKLYSLETKAPYYKFKEHSQLSLFDI